MLSWKNFITHTHLSNKQISNLVQNAETNIVRPNQINLIVPGSDNYNLGDVNQLLQEIELLQVLSIECICHTEFKRNWWKDHWKFLCILGPYTSRNGLGGTIVERKDSRYRRNGIGKFYFLHNFLLEFYYLLLRFFNYFVPDFVWQR
jgi:hypothetical protein